MAKQSGILGQVQIEDVLRPIEGQRLTGVMRLTSPNGESSGVIFFHLGTVIHAVIGATSGEEAVYALLGIGLDSGASYTFRYPDATVAKQPRTIQQRSALDLLMAAGKIADTTKRVMQHFPDPKAVPYFLGAVATSPEKGPAIKAAGAKMQPEDKPIVEAIDGVLSFEEIAAKTAIDSLSVRQTACVLKDAGVLAAVNPSTTGKVNRRKASFFDRSRQVLLPGRLETWWKSMPLYEQHPLQAFRLTTSSGVHLEISTVKFDPSIPGDEFHFPTDQLTRLGLNEGDQVILRPA